MSTALIALQVRLIDRMPSMVVSFDWRSPLALGVSPDVFGLGVTVVAFGPLRVGLFRERDGCRY